ncbi:MAG: hypothetical protein WBC18_20715 [Ottowia sp.]|uniref:hypothetical protein n=1 Tax=Ottowia sp. TaxID=1898956 RepID=UPI003C71556E
METLSRLQAHQEMQIRVRDRPDSDHFLKSQEGRIPNAQEIEFNDETIISKFKYFPIKNILVEKFSGKNIRLDVIYIFQAFEHIANAY